MNSKPPIGVGIIGVGFGQYVHLPAFRAVEGFTVVAIGASSEDKAREVAGKYGLRPYGHWPDLIEDPDVDVVSVATPPNVQPDIVSTALSAGKAILCEKPLGISSERTLEVCSLALSTGIANAVDFIFTEVDAWKRVRSILKEGVIGHLYQIRVVWQVETYAHRMGINSWKTAAGIGGVLLNFLPHVLFNLEWFGGGISSLQSELSGAPHAAGDGDTLAIVAGKLENDVSYSVHVDCCAFSGVGHVWEFYGDRGKIVLENKTSDYIDGFRILQCDRISEPTHIVEAHGGAGDGRIAPLSKIVASLKTRIEGGSADCPTIEDGHHVQVLLEAVERASRTGTRLFAPSF